MSQQPRRSSGEVEQELVRRNYADSLTSDLAKVTGLTEDQVHRLAKRLGLPKSKSVKGDAATNGRPQAITGVRRHDVE